MTLSLVFPIIVASVFLLVFILELLSHLGDFRHTDWKFPKTKTTFAFCCLFLGLWLFVELLEPLIR